MTDELFHLPAEVSAAIVAVAAKVRQIGKDEKNPHGGYAYLSVDKMYDVIGPLMADAGLFLFIDEVSSEVREGAKGNPWLFTRYALRFAHASGACAPVAYRSLALPINGPQTFGSAQSYIEKQFLRQVFKVPIGEKDADQEKQEDGVAPVTVPHGRPVQDTGQSLSLPRPPLKPLQPPPQQPVYDPETGEVGPHLIPAPYAENGGVNWPAWGRKFMDALQASKSLDESQEWIAANTGLIVECEEKAPNAYRSVNAMINLALKPDFLTADDDPLRPL